MKYIVAFLNINLYFSICNPSRCVDNVKLKKIKFFLRKVFFNGLWEGLSIHSSGNELCTYSVHLPVLIVEGTTESHNIVSAKKTLQSTREAKSSILKAEQQYTLKY